MFRSCSAWFSQSVGQELCDFWGEGGTFSILCFFHVCFYKHILPFPSRIHKSCDYIEGKATVFHSCYLSANASSEMKQTVLLGHFILPPACLQEEIKRKIGSFIWEQMNNSQIEQYAFQSIKPKKKKTVGFFFCLLVFKYNSIEKPVARQPAGKKLSCYPLQDYPVNNMVTGNYQHRAMETNLFELCDFIPGTSDYVAYWVQDEINIFSDVKNKLKRKL
uniref:Telomere repeat binding bouquet formation protein 2 n=1 Tax=Crocodylus porosus TaxID=8502 RepID=A0A7M4EC53_CROPO